MKITRIRLLDFRATRRREIELAATGVTVVEGPNEAGKSSLLEAIRLVFDEPDSTQKKAVREIKPLDRDVGPEVEIEASSGEYRFVYRKRFVKRPETELRIIEPRRLTLTGREAHDRMTEILESTMDLALWRALSMRQGDAVAQAELKDTPSLAQALDLAAGRERAGDREIALFEAVNAEFLRYHTPTGRPGKALTDAAEDERRVGEEVERLDAELRRLQADVERAERLAEERAALTRRLAEDEAEAARWDGELAGLVERTRRLELLELEAARAGERREALVARRADRASLIAQAEDAACRHRLSRETLERNLPALEDAELGTREARVAAAEAEAGRECAEAARRRSEDDLAHLSTLEELSRLEERCRRIEAERRRAAEARDVVEASGVDGETLESIRSADHDFQVAEARLETDSPRLQLRGLTDVEPIVDGVPIPIEAGRVVERTVHERATVRIADLLELTVIAGTGSAQASERRDTARAELARRLRRAGVEDRAQAERVHRTREEAERRAERCEAVVAATLDGEPLEALLRRVEELSVRARRSVDDRPAGSPLPSDPTAAERSAEAARAKAEIARQSGDRSRSSLVEAEERLRELRAAVDAARFDLRVAGEAEQRAHAALESSRGELDDRALDEALVVANERAGDAIAARAAARRELETIHPQRVEELTRTAHAAVEDGRRRLTAVIDDEAQVRGRLEALGERGLFEAREDAAARLEHLRRERRRTEQRAAAARLLHDTMRDRREATRAAYRAPLRWTIVELGRLLFDDGFDVELDDDLRIASRTLDGLTVPFDRLSVGTQEQLGLIARLAGAMLVSDRGGVPLLLDDTLGHADPERLRRMGAVLGLAGRRCQVIVLTCVPERFRSIAGATVVSFDGVSG